MSTELQRAAHVPLPPSVSSLRVGVDEPPSREEYELQDHGSLSFSTSTSIGNLPQRNVSSLAPTDGGFKAWSFLAAAFVVQAVVWAFPTSFGVLLSAYLREANLTSQPNASKILPLIGTISSGIMYCSVPFIFPVLHRFPKHKRTCIYIGLLLCFVSLFGASYATKVRDLLILQGLVYAIGGSILYAPCISFLSEWFVRKRGLANGIMFAGTAVGGLILPLIMPVLVNSVGPSKTLRILSLAFIVLILPGLPFLRPRLPEISVRARQSRSNAENGRNLLRSLNVPFLLYVLANLLQGFAYFLPLLWLPTFASDLNLSDTQSSLTVALLNGASVLSRVVLGTLTDKFSPWILALATTLFTSLATFVLWGVFSRNFAGVLAFAFTYGALSGGWSSLFSGFAKPIAKDNPTNYSTLYGIYMLTRGIGNILSTTISTALSNIDSVSAASGNVTSSSYSSSHPSLGFDVADGRYMKMIVYVGSCFAGAGVIAMFGWGIDAYGARARARRA